MADEEKYDIKISDMMKMQMELWELNKDNWSPMEAKYGRNFLLWMIEEMGEVISIIKKKGVKKGRVRRNAPRTESPRKGERGRRAASGYPLSCPRGEIRRA